MRWLILIGNEKFDLNTIKSIKHYGCVNCYDVPNIAGRYCVDFGKDHIFYDYNENIEEFEENNTIIIGISKDSQKSHQNFIQKHNLKILLLSDTERQVIEAYGVWQEKKLYGKISMGIVRTTFIIDEQGNIEKIYEKVKAAENPTEILKYIKEK